MTTCRVKPRPGSRWGELLRSQCPRVKAGAVLILGQLCASVAPTTELQVCKCYYVLKCLSDIVLFRRVTVSCKHQKYQTRSGAVYSKPIYHPLLIIKPHRLLSCSQWTAVGSKQVFKTSTKLILGTQCSLQNMHFCKRGPCSNPDSMVNHLGKPLNFLVFPYL